MRRTDWRLGGRTVMRWNERLLAIALVWLGLGIVLAFAAQLYLGVPLVATALLWAGMVVPIILALRRSRPVGLLRFRAVDLLWGLAFGLAARGLYGALSNSAWPSYPLVNGSLAGDWMLTGLVGPVVIAPVVEELFFRMVVLVCVYSLLRRSMGPLLAGGVALLASVGVFVLAHAATGIGDVASAIALAAVGVVCGLATLLTGRIWTAVLVHLVYNATFVVLALVGTFLR